ncbi:MAG TPA: hypothetical protein VHD63_00055 [Ktedonobacteraceae bacterium]|nr:hypothetical protein [Ktedonobacteraceae bacterium]
MKRSFLGRLQRTAWLNVIGALLLLLLVPILLLLVLGPQGYGTALNTAQTSLAWIQGHVALFVLYRLTLILGFALLLGLPFALFRIIITQEIIGRAELEADEAEEDEEGEEAEEDVEEEQESEKEEPEKAAQPVEGLPDFAWRGKGFAVIAAWTGLLAVLFVAGGTLASTIYLWSTAGVFSAQGHLPDNFTSVTGIFAILTYTVGGGLLALASIFFGLVIARSGRRLWPDSWVAFSYMALIAGAVASGSAVQVALAPSSSQATLTTPAILLIAIWSLWFGIMVVRLKAE